MQIPTAIPARDKAALLGAELKTGARAAAGEMLVLLEADDRHKAAEQCRVRQAGGREARIHMQLFKARL